MKMKAIFLVAMLLVTMVAAAPNGDKKRAAPVIPRAPDCAAFGIGECKDSCSAGESEYPEPDMCAPGEVCCEDDGTVIGDPHITTLDGKKITTQGKCHYVLTQDCVDQSKPQWKVTIADVKGEFEEHPVTRVESVTISVGTHSVTLGPGSLVTVNGKVEKGALKKVDLGRKDLSLSKEDGTTEFHYNGHFSVSFDGRHQVNVRVSPSLEKEVCGLFGNNDGNPDNDLKMSNGNMAKDDEEFAASWMVPNSCED